MKKTWLKFIQGFAATITTTISNVPADMPQGLRDSLKELQEPVTLLMGKLPTTADKDDEGIPAESAIIISEIMGDQATIIAGIPKLVADERAAALAAALKDGTHLSKDAVTAMVNAARTEGETAAGVKFKTVSARTTLLAGAGLPIDISEELLAGKEEDFTAAQTEATRRAGVLKADGLDIQAGKERTRLLFGIPKDEFESQVALFKTFAKKPTTPAPHPMKTGAVRTADGKVPIC